jgi:hypothetical protein
LSKFEQQWHAPAFVHVDTGKPRTPPLVIASERKQQAEIKRKEQTTAIISAEIENIKP